MFGIRIVEWSAQGESPEKIRVSKKAADVS
jgi:hypothetical protein